MKRNPRGRATAVACLVLLAFALAWPGDSLAAALRGEHPFLTLIVPIEGQADFAQAALFERAMGEAERVGAGLLLVRLNASGGRNDAVAAMTDGMLKASLPVAVWVGPTGARAGGAAATLLAAAHVAAMSPRSVIGVGLPMDESEAARMADPAQVGNVAAGFAYAAAQSRGRSGAWYARFLQEGVSLSAERAAELRVIDRLAVSPEDLLSQLSAEGVPYGGMSLPVGDAVEFRDYGPGLRHGLHSWLLDPQIAYILLLAGMAGLFLEMVNPGAILPGVVGGLSLLLAVYALSLLPTNPAGVLLLVFGLILFGLEVVVTSFGLLTLAGAASLFAGSLILYRVEYDFTGLPFSTVIFTVLTLTALLGGVVWLASRAQFRKPATGVEAMVGETAEVRDWSLDQSGRGRVVVRGELWSARADRGEPFVPGERVRIVRLEGLRLLVERIEPMNGRESTRPGAASTPEAQE